MTNEEFKKIPFKYDGNGKPVTFGEAGTFFTRKERRNIKRLIEKRYSVTFGEAGTFFTRKERRNIKRLIEKGYSVSEAMDKTI